MAVASFYSPLRAPTRHADQLADYFQNLYFSNGAFIAYTSDPASMPDVADILSAYPETPDRVAAGQERWQVVSKRARRPTDTFGKVVVRKAGIAVSLRTILTTGSRAHGTVAAQRRGERCDGHIDAQSLLSL